MFCYEIKKKFPPFMIVFNYNLSVHDNNDDEIMMQIIQIKTYFLHYMLHFVSLCFSHSFHFKQQQKDIKNGTDFFFVLQENKNHS